MLKGSFGVNAIHLIGDSSDALDDVGPADAIVDDTEAADDGAAGVDGCSATEWHETWIMELCFCRYGDQRRAFEPVLPGIISRPVLLVGDEVLSVSSCDQRRVGEVSGELDRLVGGFVLEEGHFSKICIQDADCEICAVIREASERLHQFGEIGLLGHGAALSVVGYGMTILNHIMSDMSSLIATEPLGFDVTLPTFLSQIDEVHYLV